MKHEDECIVVKTKCNDKLVFNVKEARKGF